MSKNPLSPKTPTDWLKSLTSSVHLVRQHHWECRMIGADGVFASVSYTGRDVYPTHIVRWVLSQLPQSVIEHHIPSLLGIAILAKSSKGHAAPLRVTPIEDEVMESMIEMNEANWTRVVERMRSWRAEHLKDWIRNEKVGRSSSAEYVWQPAAYTPIELNVKPVVMDTDLIDYCKALLTKKVDPRCLSLKIEPDYGGAYIWDQRGACTTVEELWTEHKETPALAVGSKRQLGARMEWLMEKWQDHYEYRVSYEEGETNENFEWEHFTSFSIICSMMATATSGVPVYCQPPMEAYGASSDWEKNEHAFEEQVVMAAKEGWILTEAKSQNEQHAPTELKKLFELGRCWFEVDLEAQSFWARLLLLTSPKAEQKMAKSRQIKKFEEALSQTPIEELSLGFAGFHWAHVLAYLGLGAQLDILVERNPRVLEIRNDLGTSVLDALIQNPTESTSQKLPFWLAAWKSEQKKSVKTPKFPWKIEGRDLQDPLQRLLWAVENVNKSNIDESDIKLSPASLPGALSELKYLKIGLGSGNWTSYMSKWRNGPFKAVILEVLEAEDLAKWMQKKVKKTALPVRGPRL